jgi:hypothetical protein
MSGNLKIKVMAPQVVLIQRADGITSTTTPINTPGGSSSSTPTGSVVPQAQAQQGADGLSTGAKAAIGAVVPLLVLGFALAGYMLLYRRRRRNRREDPASPAEKGGGEKAELEANSLPLMEHLRGGSELDGTPRVSPLELELSPPRQELPGSFDTRVVSGMFELPGDHGFASGTGKTAGGSGEAAKEKPKEKPNVTEPSSEGQKRGAAVEHDDGRDKAKVAERGHDNDTWI